MPLKKNIASHTNLCSVYTIPTYIHTHIDMTYNCIYCFLCGGLLRMYCDSVCLALLDRSSFTRLVAGRAPPVQWSQR